MKPLSAPAGLFICAMLRKESVRFRYSRKWTLNRLRETTLRLPVSSGEPDIAAMERFVTNLRLGWMFKSEISIEMPALTAIL